MKTKVSIILSCLCLSILGGYHLLKPQSHFNQNLHSQSTLVLGSVLALKGQEEGLGNRMKIGLESALKEQKIQGKNIRLIFENDYYEPATTEKKTEKLIQEHNLLLMIGNVGTPTAQVSLPILERNRIPAVGFFTGADLLRAGKGLIVNFRASYAQEIDAVVDLAIRQGLKPEQLCAYVQNDSYGMSGLRGLKKALAPHNPPPQIIQAYNQILSVESAEFRQKPIGPMGVYTRNTPNVKDGYESIKLWEKRTRYQCRLIITVGSYSNIARFANYAKSQGERWIISAVSFTGGDDYKIDLAEYGITKNIVMTHVAPLLDSDLPIVKEARSALKSDFGHVTLEGYIVGKMTLAILNNITGDITSESFMAEVSRSKFDLGGIEIDFSKNRHQGSDTVILSYLVNKEFKTLDEPTFKRMLQETL